MHRMMKTGMVAALALGAVGVAGRLAGAEDIGTYYPAFACVEKGTNVSTIDRSEYRISKLAGTPGASAIVLCPIDHRDFETSSWGGPDAPGVDTATVHVLDIMFNANVKCTLGARDHDGTELMYETKSTSGVQSGGTDLQYDGDGKNTKFNSYYFFTCELPTNVGNELAKIYSYRVKEI